MIIFFKKRWVYHSLFWAISILILLSNSMLGQDGYFFDSTELFIISVIVSSIIVITYTHFFLIDRFFKKRKYLEYTVGVVSLALGFVMVIEIADFSGAEFTDPPIKNFFSAVLFCAIGAGARYFKRGIINQYQLQELKAKNAEIELQMLKTQLNPHFLFNTLNNICGINQIDADKGTEMLMELAEILRYHLSHSEVEMTSLKEEVELIQSYIALEQLRVTESSQINMEFPTQFDGITIPPLLFLPFIENAFKHGTHPNKPSFVNLSISVNENVLTLLVENSVHKNLKAISTHIGLNNTKRRLNLLFPNRHTLILLQDTDRYQVKLSLQL